MSETLPRWNLPEVEFVTTDTATIESEIITQYETLTGRTLAAGDPVRLFLLAIASIIIQQRAYINTAAQQNLLSYARGQYLDALGLYMNVTRLEASHAVTTIAFTLSQSLANDYTIPAGFEVTNGVVTFATDEDLIIPAGETVGTVSATCNASGGVGNDYLAGQIATIVTPLTFLATAQNITTTTGGAEVESDADYAERIRMAPNSFSVAGPAKAYIFHTFSVSSAIIDVSVSSPTPGVVNVYPLLEGGQLPSSEILDEIADYLSADDIRPLTDDVHVLAPETTEYTINVDYWINESDKSRADAIRAAVTEAVNNYKDWQQTKIGRDITPAQLIANVVNAGAARIDAATMQPAAFVHLDPDEIAQCTSVTVTYKGYKDI